MRRIRVGPSDGSAPSQVAGSRPVDEEDPAVALRRAAAHDVGRPPVGRADGVEDREVAPPDTIRLAEAVLVERADPVEPPRRPAYLEALVDVARRPRGVEEHVDVPGGRVGEPDLVVAGLLVARVAERLLQPILELRSHLRAIVAEVVLVPPEALQPDGRGDDDRERRQSGTPDT